LDHLVDRPGVALGLGGALGHGRHQLVGVELRALAGGADEAVAGPARVAGDHGPAGRDVDGDLTVGHVVDRRTDGAVVLAVEVDPVPAPQLAHQPDRFAQPREALLERGPFADVAGGDLVERLAGAEAGEDPVRVQAAHGGAGPGARGRVVGYG